jgi:hypothetical protein
MQLLITRKTTSTECLFRFHKAHHMQHSGMYTSTTNRCSSAAQIIESSNSAAQPRVLPQQSTSAWERATTHLETLHHKQGT